MKYEKREKRKRQVQVGSVSRSGGQTIRSYTVGALPILNHIIKRTRLEEFLGQYVREDDRCIIPPSVGIVILLKNFLTSRQPIYGVSEWACRHPPELLGLSKEEVQSMNGDRVVHNAHRFKLEGESMRKKYGMNPPLKDGPASKK